MSNSNIEKAIAAVKEGELSAGQAARTFNVPETSLRSRLSKLGIVAKIVSVMVLFFAIHILQLFLNKRVGITEVYQSKR